MKTLKGLIWIYLGLLITEGAVRKWLLPQLSDPLLIIRDPVAILIYLQALRIGKFPQNPWMIAIGTLALSALVIGLLAEFVNPWVIGFGLRTNFLHLPLVFVVAQAFDETDVKRVGKVCLMVALPIAVLMALQFRAPPSDWLNVGVGGGGQISSAMGKIRPAGTFSFISGPIFFFATVSAFAFAALLANGSRSLLLSALGIGSTILAASVSGSRSLLGAVAIVVAAVFAGLLLYPRAAVGAIRLLIVIGLIFSALSGTQIYREGQTVLESRIVNAGKGEGGLQGFVRRFVTGFTEPIGEMVETPLFGKGLGLGTNAGAGLVGSRGHFLLAEGEWSRVIAESGPVVGSAFLLFRVLLAGYLGLLAADCARQGRLLPLLLFGVAGLGIINGQWGQPTTQGFSCLLGGLCLASMRQASQTRTVALAHESRLERDFLKQFSVNGLLTNSRRDVSQTDAVQPGRFAIRG